MKIRLALSALLLIAFPAWPGVTELPPSIADVAGAYVGSVGGTTLQRLVVNSDGTGLFADVWFASDGEHVTYYQIKVDSYRNWKIVMELSPVEAGDQTMRASGEASYFEMKLRLSRSERYRPRSVFLVREQTFRSMLDFAHATWPAPK